MFVSFDCNTAVVKFGAEITDPSGAPEFDL